MLYQLSYASAPLLNQQPGERTEDEHVAETSSARSFPVSSGIGFIVAFFGAGTEDQVSSHPLLTQGHMVPLIIMIAVTIVPLTT
jgi:hypothetical protein